MKMHRIKSKFYYIFWGIIGISAVSGQIYIGNGYLKIVESNKHSMIEVTCLPPYVTPPPKQYNNRFEFE